MSIDRIGKGAGVGLAPGVATPEAAAAVEPFRVERSGAAHAVSPLDRLHAGEIDVNQYLDLRVEQATAHLEGKLPGDQLSFIRESLRAQLETDPMLVELVAKAAGAAFEKPSSGA